MIIYMYLGTKIYLLYLIPLFLFFHFPFFVMHKVFSPNKIFKEKKLKSAQRSFGSIKVLCASRRVVVIVVTTNY